LSEVSLHAAEVAEGGRFEFGKNWSRFLGLLDEDRISEAEKSLKRMLAVDSLAGKTFVDVGSGSGLFSLAARRLGATVHSFDYDPQSVACTTELRRRYFPNDNLWRVEEGSALDQAYLASLGTYDIVYSWGVLHHTGQMWLALENVEKLVTPGGQLFIAIYNDTGSQSSRWRTIKQIYNQLPGLLKAPFTLLVMLPRELKAITKSLLTLRVGDYIRAWTQYNRGRGMNRWYDMVDWVGGYPYEVASPDEIFDFYTSKGFILKKLVCGGVGLGCNEFVFQKTGTGNQTRQAVDLPSNR
jgi:2-polyprenyl-3-methyl-5-hydroxy-6-metoxy-1,4-benzoquinol methylase